MDTALGWGSYKTDPNDPTWRWIAAPTIQHDGYSMGPAWPNRFENEPVGIFVKVKVADGHVTWFREAFKEENGERVVVWVNLSGGEWFPRHTDTVLQTQRAAKFQNLDWRGTYINQTDSDTGWLSPEGTFYPCRRENHDLYAYFILRMEPEDLNRENWVSVKPSFFGTDTWRNSRVFPYGENCDVELGKPLTQPQREWLIAHGHVVREND